MPIIQIVYETLVDLKEGKGSRGRGASGGGGGGGRSRTNNINSTYANDSGSVELVSC